MDVRSSGSSTNSTTDPIGEIVEVFLHSVTVLLGFPVHSYILWLLATGNRVTSELFFLNLSISEVLNCLSSVLGFLHFWLSSVTALSWFSLGPGTTGRPVFQCLICVERFLAVVHPVTFLKLKPLRYRIFCCSVAWTIILASCVCYWFAGESDDLYLYVFLYSVQYVVFFLIQLFCCVSVLLVLKQSGPGERKEENHRKRRAFLIILASTVNMSVVYVPFTAAGVVYILSWRYSDWSFTFGFCCFVLAGFGPPVLYLHQNRKLACRCVKC